MVSELSSALSSIKIYHLASMARSGETVLLRTLSVHPDILVPWQVNKNDNREATRFINQTRQSDMIEIEKSSYIAKKMGISEEKLVLIKQGIWEHPFPFSGFVLARNPASVYYSLKNQNRIRFTVSYFRSLYKSISKHGSLDTNKERFVRWMLNIDPVLVPQLQQLSKIDRFCFFYNRRMLALHKLKLPIIHYENFVCKPEENLKKICKILNIPFHDSLLGSHKAFPKKQKGHGGSDLSKPISRDSLKKYQNLERSEFEYIKNNTQETWKAYGYNMDWDEISAKMEDR